MNGRTRQTTSHKSSAKKGDHKLVGLIMGLMRSDLEWIGRTLLKVLRLNWRDHPLQAHEGPEQGISLPVGPFESTRKEQLGDLLLWVPRGIDSYLIDDLTGGYGYSHASIDSGEIDIPTGKPVMIESTVGQTVTRKFQDHYQLRAFVRIPISKTGVNVEQFVACVKSKIGEQYDVLDALTLGEINDPAREVCSGLAADCLPEAERQRIAQAKRLGLLRRTSVSVYSRPGELKTREFISPNGFAEYYGAPQGRKITGPDTTVQPQPVNLSRRKAKGQRQKAKG